MITKSEKERKVKLIMLIIIVSLEYARRKPFKTPKETIDFATEQCLWVVELARVMRQKTFEVGGVAFARSNDGEEVILNNGSN